MSTLPPVPALARFVKPTLDTPFHIDYTWWDEQGLDFNVQLLQHLSPDLREVYSGQRIGEKIDLIDWDTGEVRQVEGLQYLITTRCSKEPGYILRAPTLLEAIFRAFLSNGNHPLSPRALAPLVGRPPEQVLRVLSGVTVRKGLRPVMD